MWGSQSRSSPSGPAGGRAGPRWRPGVCPDLREPVGGKARPVSEGKVGAQVQTSRSPPDRCGVCRPPSFPHGFSKQPSRGRGGAGEKGGQVERARPEATMTLRLVLGDVGDTGSRAGSLRGTGYHPSGEPGWPCATSKFHLSVSRGLSRPGRWARSASRATRPLGSPSPGLCPRGSEPPHRRCLCLTSARPRSTTTAFALTGIGISYDSHVSHTICLLLIF